MNFNCWAKSLTRLVERTHGKKDYFGTEDNDPNSKRNAEIRTYIGKSIAVELSNSIKEEDKGEEVNDLINEHEARKNLNEAFATTKSTVRNLRSAIDLVWTDKTITAIFFHLCNKKHFHQISTTLDSKMSLKATYKIKAGDILHIAQQFQKRRMEPLYDHFPSLMAESGLATLQHFRHQSETQRSKQLST
ncbi:hypothetical protein O181_046722 [Austropuccinia psidii MF-1]|uniref:Uncharacterized protein n=1 Tax=Austropuccinia psidii MF-1 TaxID=1389203 RepID=A0A9Q3DRT9_9BASI|nr:hypothetical protein [Austropuccinia psidii MF-1]